LSQHNEPKSAVDSNLDKELVEILEFVLIQPQRSQFKKILELQPFFDTHAG